MKNLYIVRHGESFTNLTGSLTGWIDTPLTPDGIKESLDTGIKMAEVPFDMIFTSCLSRAIETALLMAAQNNYSRVPVILHNTDEKDAEIYNNINGFIAGNMLPILCNELLNERHYGKLQGILLNEIKEKNQEDNSLWNISFNDYDCAENLEILKKRILLFINDFLLPQFVSKENILLVAHGTLLRVMISVFENLSLDEAKTIPIKNCSVIRYEVSRNNFMRERL